MAYPHAIADQGATVDFLESGFGGALNRLGLPWSTLAMECILDPVGKVHGNSNHRCSTEQYNVQL
jgi:hypothetical protein